MADKIKAIEPKMIKSIDFGCTPQRMTPVQNLTIQVQGKRDQAGVNPPGMTPVKPPSSPAPTPPSPKKK